MKFFALVIRDIYKFVCGRTSIFLIIILGLLFNSIGISFYYGYFTNQYNERVQQDNKTNSYDFITNSNMNKNGDCYIYKLLFDKSKFPDITSATVSEHSLINNSFVKVEPKYSGVVPVGKFSNEKVMSGRYFSEEEISHAMNVTIATTNALVQQKGTLTNGDILDIKGKEYKIIGQVIYCEEKYGSIIPITTYINNGLDIKYFHVEFESFLSGDQKEYLVSELKSSYPGIDIRLPPAEDYAAKKFFMGYFAPILAIFILTITNIFSLIYYWVSTNSRKYSIFLISGCYKLKVFGLILVESLLISSVSFIAGNLLLFCFKNIFIEYGIFTSLRIRDYFMLLCINLLTSMGMGAFTGIRVTWNLDVKKV